MTSFSVNGKGLERHATDQPLYDFDFAQFYRAVADPVTAAMTGYRSRGMMMLRDDFIALYDEVDPGVSSQFTWVTQSDFPLQNVLHYILMANCRLHWIACSPLDRGAASSVGHRSHATGRGSE